MHDIFDFNARKKSWDGKTWKWYPSLHSLSGRNLSWDKGFKTKEEAINFLHINFKIIKQDWF